MSVYSNFDQLLTTISTVSWAIFIIAVVIYFVRTLFTKGIKRALILLFSFRVLLPFLLVVGLGLLSRSLVFVEPPEVAVVISLISPGGVRPRPLQAGLHWIVPFFEDVVTYPIKWQTYTMSNKLGEGQRSGDDSIRARTSDGQEVRLDTSIIFRIDPEQAVLIHVDWQDRYIDDLIRPLTRGFVRTQVSQFTVKEVNSSSRRNLEALLDELLRAEMADKGLILDKFLLRDITFTTQYAEAIEQKQVALELETQKEREARQIRNLAIGRADAIRIEAEAQAQALRLIASALKENPDLLTYHYIDKLSPNIRAMLIPNNTPLILPLPEIGLEDAMNGTSPLSGTTPLTTTPILTTVSDIQIP